MSGSTATSTPANSSDSSWTMHNSPGSITFPNSSCASTKLSPPKNPSLPSTPAWLSPSPEKCSYPPNPTTPSRKNISSPFSATLLSSSNTPSSPGCSTTSLPTPQPRDFSEFPAKLFRSLGGPHERIREDLHQRRNHRHLETRRLHSLREMRSRPRRSLQRQRSPVDQYGRPGNRAHHPTSSPLPFPRAKLFSQ